RGKNLRRVDLQVSQENGRTKTGAAAALHGESEVDLLVGFAGGEIESGGDLAAVQAVAFEQAPLPGHGLLQQGIRVGSAQVQPRRIPQLRGVGGARNTSREGNVADEPAINRKRVVEGERVEV